MCFYLTRLAPGKAEGADELSIFTDYANNAVASLGDDDAIEFEEEFDDDDEIRPLTYFFPRSE